MEITKAFFDFCIPYQSDPKKMRTILTELIKLGYKTVAIEQIYDHSKKDGKKSSDIFPPPVSLDFLNDFRANLKILQRLTIIYSDVAISHPMTSSSNIKKFNIVAGLPKNDTALNHCFTTFNGDLICFDPEGSKLVVQRKPYLVAVKRGMYFEIKYAHVIKDSTYRKDIIKIAHNYHIKGKSKNIIFSSGATNCFELRGPYDIANLALIFGLSEEQGKSSISNSCRQLYLRAEARRLGKTIMFAKTDVSTSLLSSEDNCEDDSEDSDSNVTDTEMVDENVKAMKIQESYEHPFKKKKLN